MEHTEQINELAGALAKAQGAMSNVIADQKASIQTRAGGTYSYNYADLASILQAIRKPLSENGLCILQGIHDGQGCIIIMTALMHASGQWVRSELAMPLPDGATPQNIGSVITYGRRYGLAALIGIAQEDDDAKSVSEKPQQPPRPQAARPTPPTPIREVDPKQAERTERLKAIALKRWPDIPGEHIGAKVGEWLKEKYPITKGIWATLSEVGQEEAIVKLEEEAELA